MKRQVSRGEVNIENVVATTEIERELDLQELAMDLRSEYVPEEFPGLIYRLDDPKTTALVFRSGKVVCTGAKDINAVHRCFEQLFAELRRLSIPVPDTPDVIIQNIVASGGLGRRLDLNAVAIGLGLENVEYEPEQFPALIYRLPDSDVAVLIFGSGKVVVTGAKDPEVSEQAIEQIETRLSELGLLIE